MIYHKMFGIALEEKNLYNRAWLFKTTRHYSLVNIVLKFQALISDSPIFFVEKCDIFSTKNVSVFGC